MGLFFQSCDALPVVEAHGARIPRIGLGTWRSTHEGVQAVRAALAAGYRHIDTARMYGKNVK